MWGKRWTRRTVAGHRFKEKVDEELKNLVESGSHTILTGYQPALTKVWNGLSKEVQEKCAEDAKKWTSGQYPAERQIE